MSTDKKVEVKQNQALSEDEIYRRSIKRRIRNGELPRYCFVKGKNEKLEKEYYLRKGKMRSRLTLRLKSTLHTLCGKEKK